jgi:hypothetical protein
MRKTTAISTMLMLVGALCASFAAAQTTPDLSGTLRCAVNSWRRM